jgi:hypothetical protein
MKRARLGCLFLFCLGGCQFVISGLDPRDGSDTDAVGLTDDADTDSNMNGDGATPSDSATDLTAFDARPVDMGVDLASDMKMPSPDLVMPDIAQMSDLTSMPDLRSPDLSQPDLLMQDLILPPDMTPPPDLAPNIQIIATNPLMNANDDAIFGACNNRKAAQDFLPTITGKITKLRVSLRKVGAPADGVVVKIYKGGNIPEEGQLLITSQTVPAAQIMANLSVVEFTFSMVNPPQLQMGLRYFFVVERTGAFDCAEVDVYRLANGGNTYPDGKYWTKWQTDMLTGWSAFLYPNFDFVFEVYGDIS